MVIKSGVYASSYIIVQRNIFGADLEGCSQLLVGAKGLAVVSKPRKTPNNLYPETPSMIPSVTYSV